MKADSEGSQSTSQPQSQPQQQYSNTQWSSSTIQIDPALQQQSQQPTTQPYAHYPNYTTHYPQANYTSQYQFTAQTSQPVRQNSSSANNGIDTADLATLNDALGSAGVDLRAEEEGLQRTYDQHHIYRPYEDRSRKQPSTPSFDTNYLGSTMRDVATQYKVTKVPEDSINYLALALRARLQDLITQMIAASHHRTDTQFDRPASFYEDGTPMWSIRVRSDVGKQLAALEKAERDEETRIRRERKERADMAAQHAKDLATQAAGGASAMSESGFDDGEGGSAKKKRKKDGPGVTARNMSEDVRKKMSNAVATQAAGLGGKYAWMTAANAATAAPKPKAVTSPSTPAGTTTALPASTTAPVTTSGWSRPYVPTKKSLSSAPTQGTEEDSRTVVTLRDALFVIEKEGGHGGGRGAARGWV